MDCREQSNGLEILVSDASFPFLRTSSSTVSVKIAVGPEEVSKTWTEGWWKHHVFFFFFSELSKIYDAKVGGPELEVWHYGGCLESPDPPRSDCWPCPRNKGKKLNRKKKKYWDTRKNISGFVDSTLEISALSQLMFLVEEVKAFLEATWVYGRARLETVLWPHGGS